MYCTAFDERAKSGDKLSKPRGKRGWELARNRQPCRTPALDRTIHTALTYEKRAGFNEVMNSSQLKWLGVVTMIIDHIGALFFPEVILLRIIGRLTFPIFAWMIVVGAEHTHDWKRYALRLAAFGVLSEFPYLLARRIIDPEFFGLNVLFTLLLGLLAVIAIRRVPVQMLAVFPVAAAMLLAEGLRCDYGAFGIMVIVLFALLRTRPRALALSLSALYLFPHLFLLGELRTLATPLLVLEHFVQLFALLALPLILTTRDDAHATPRTPWWVFYLIYPLQFLVLAAIALTLGAR